MAVDLELVGLRKTYPNGATAVEDVALTVEQGEFVSLVGPSGCGKTTTLRMIAGFETITAGDVLIRGKRINDMPPEKRPTSTIFQNFALFPHMTVAQEHRIRSCGARHQASGAGRTLSPDHGET